MNLEHGKSYINGHGELVTVYLYEKSPPEFPFIGDNGKTYTEDGRFTPCSMSDHDLVGPALSAF